MRFGRSREGGGSRSVPDPGCCWLARRHEAAFGPAIAVPSLESSSVFLSPQPGGSLALQESRPQDTLFTRVIGNKNGHEFQFILVGFQHILATAWLWTSSSRIQWGDRHSFKKNCLTSPCGCMSQWPLTKRVCMCIENTSYWFCFSGWTQNS